MHCKRQEGMHVHVKDYRALANFSCPLLLWNELTQNISFNTKPCCHVIPSFPNSFLLLHELLSDYLQGTARLQVIINLE